MLEIYLDRHQERIDEQERDLVRLRADLKGQRDSMEHRTDKLRDQLRQTDLNASQGKAARASLVEICKILKLDMDELRKKVATLESKVAVMEAALSPTHRRSVSWEPTIPPPGYVQREFGRFNVAIGRLQRHLGLDEESLEQAAKRRRST